MVDPDSHEPKTATLAILSGSDVMLWDLSFPIRDNGKPNPNSNPIQEEQPPQIRVFDPYPQYDDGVPISSIAWNHNQMVLATSSGISTDDFAHHNVVLLSSQTGQTLDSFQHDLEWKQKQQYVKDEQFQNIPWSAVNSVNFGGKSRYLCIGDEGGAVCLWDLKKKIRVRQFFHTRIDHNNSGSMHPSPSNQVSLDPTDTYVLSLSPLVLYQYNLRDGQLVGTLQLPKSDDIGVSHFSLFSISDLEPNLCALGTDDGSIYIHDITSHSNSSQSQPLFKMPQTHSGEVTGLAFSLANPDILFSCGNDGVILVHNKAERRSYRIRGALDRIDSSIESMSLHANGVTCAIGCKSGDVVVYNIQTNPNGEEMSATLLASFQSSEPIQSLSFAPPPRPKHKQRQPENNNENNAPKESTPSSAGVVPTASVKKSAKPKPMSPTAGSPNLAQRATRTRAASPFAKKLSELSSTPKSPKKQQKTERPPLTNLRLTPSPGRKPNSTQNNQQQQSQTEQIRDVVREEVENLQDEMEEQLRNLHIDMINQFHQQSQEMEAVISKHFAAMERLTLENQQLREENERLRMGQRG